MPKCRLMLAAMLMLGVATATAAQAQGVAAVPPRGDAPVFYIKLYKFSHQKGESIKLTKTENAISGGFDNKARSIRVYGRWKLCDGVNFTGTCNAYSQHSMQGNQELPANLVKKVSSVKFLGGV